LLHRPARTIFPMVRSDSTRPTPALTLVCLALALNGTKSRDRLTLDGYLGGGPEANDICALIPESEDR
jgi:hypothetical protein